jgi:hypothetical protein
LPPPSRRHDRLRKSTEIPLFYGIAAKDTQTPGEFIDRINNAQQAAGWDDPRKLVEMQNCLRGPALEWWKYMRSAGINTANWNDVRTNFRSTFERKYTAHLHTLSLKDLNIKPNETMTEFQMRVHQTFRNVIDNRGNMADVAACDNFYMKIHFIAGLPTEVRTEVMKQPRATFEDAAVAARDADILLADRKSARVNMIIGMDPRGL